MSEGSPASLDRYEPEQRAVATQVQRDNARIFANLALRSVPAAAVRNTALRAMGHLPGVTARMARSEALLHLPAVPHDTAVTVGRLSRDGSGQRMSDRRPRGNGAADALGRHV